MWPSAVGMVFMSVMQSHDYDFRLPRLFLEAPLQGAATLPLTGEQTHYLKTVMRRPDGAQLRVFNGRDGEWLGTLSFHGKKDGSVVLQRQIRAPVARALKLHLVFAPVKKDRMDFMVEKAVELGVTDLHPVLTKFTVIRDINEERMTRQMHEASEQCERLDIPALHKLQSLRDFVKSWDGVPLLSALEREDAPFIGRLSPVPAETGLIIGPEGGFSEEERTLLITPDWVKPVNLGPQILRSETAAIFGLSVLLGNFTE